MVQLVPFNEATDGALDPAFDEPVDGAVGDPVQGAEIEESLDWSARIAEASVMGMLTAMEADVLTVAFALGEQERSWRELGRRVGCSHHRARRAFLEGIHKWHAQCQLTDRLVERTEVVGVQIRGQRQRELWQQHAQQLGTRRITRRELITKTEQAAGVGAAHDPAGDHTYWLLPTSPMRQLLHALAVRLSNLPDASAQQVGDSSDWERNVRWAERKIRRARRSAQFVVAFREILRALARGSHLCPNCHTPVLVGCWIDGRRINRARRFCGSPCKMRWVRRQTGSGMTAVISGASLDVAARR
jgi:hypothetical protein